ncbi:MAG TPA: QsdR family transcriptional regulator [Acidimicrobiales bacterium]|nr:QsdR family transcriptional regulator [Acidimicrobiales bacterium]
MATAAAPTTIFRRATPDDARALATSAFLDGRRIDMQELAANLGIGRATLYRWVSSREELISQVLEFLAQDFIAVARAGITGRGNAAILDFVRSIVDAVSAFEPASVFIRQEPLLGLRLLVGEEGRVYRRVCAGLRELVLEQRPDVAVEAVDRLVPIVVQEAGMMIWTSLAIGERPRVERICTVAEALLEMVVPPKRRPPAAR